MTLLLPDRQVITARLAGAGSVRDELERVLMSAAEDTTQEDFRRLVVDENVTGKATEVTRTKTWRRLWERYLMDPAVPEFQAFAAAMRSTFDPGDRGLLAFLMFARVEKLFREVALEVVSSRLGKPGSEIDAMVVHEAVERRVAAAGAQWTETTMERVRQHILSSLKDYGVLKGSRRKVTQAIRPGAPIVVFAVQLSRLEGLTDRQALESTWFRLLGIGREDATNYLYAAARTGAIEFRMQADVVEISIPPVGVRA